MQRNIVVLILSFIFVIPATGFGQLKKSDTERTDFATLVTNGQPRAKSIAGFLGLDPSRFQMTQSYTLGVMSIDGTAISQGVYLNSMTYNFSIPLTFNIEWGVRMNPMQAGNNPTFPGLNNGLFLSGASLEYKPSKNLQIGVHYSTYQQGIYPGSYTRSRSLLHNTR